MSTLKAVMLIIALVLVINDSSMTNNFKSLPCFYMSTVLVLVTQPLKKSLTVQLGATCIAPVGLVLVLVLEGLVLVFVLVFVGLVLVLVDPVFVFYLCSLVLLLIIVLKCLFLSLSLYWSL